MLHLGMAGDSPVVVGFERIHRGECVLRCVVTAGAQFREERFFLVACVPRSRLTEVAQSDFQSLSLLRAQCGLSNAQMNAAPLVFLDSLSILNLCSFLCLRYNRDQNVQKPFDTAMAV